MVPCGSNCSYGMSLQASRRPHNNSLSEYKLGLQAYSFIPTIMDTLIGQSHCPCLSLKYFLFIDRPE